MGIKLKFSLFKTPTSFFYYIERFNSVNGRSFALVFVKLYFKEFKENVWTFTIFWTVGFGQAPLGESSLFEEIAFRNSGVQMQVQIEFF